MELHIGTKLVNAKPMNRQEYNDYRGWELPENENGEDTGFLVEYLDGGESNHPEHDGYISWSPTGVFESAYKVSGQFTFGDAVLLMKMGRKVARAGWNGADMYVLLVKGGKTLSVGAFYEDGHCDSTKLFKTRDHMMLKTAQNDLAMWAPSGSDSLAEDWVIVG